MTSWPLVHIIILNWNELADTISCLNDVFSDDDAIPEPNWLVELRKAVDSKPDYDIFIDFISQRTLFFFFFFGTLIGLLPILLREDWL